MDLEMFLEVQFGDLVNSSVYSRDNVLDGNGLLPGVVENVHKVLIEFVEFVDRVLILEAIKYAFVATFTADDRGGNRSIAAVFVSPLRWPIMAELCFSAGSVVKLKQNLSRIV